MSDNTLEIKRVIKAPIERVFKAFTNAEDLKQWHSPMGLSTAMATSDLRVGGNYSIAMQNQKDETFTALGEYKEIDEPNKLVFSWNWKEGMKMPVDSTVTVRFTKINDDSTEIILTHEFAMPEPVEGHKKGWEGVLTKLEEYLG